MRKRCRVSKDGSGVGPAKSGFGPLGVRWV